jgi:hypothetical protein
MKMNDAGPPEGGLGYGWDGEDRLGVNEAQVWCTHPHLRTDILNCYSAPHKTVTGRYDAIFEHSTSLATQLHNRQLDAWVQAALVNVPAFAAKAQHTQILHEDDDDQDLSATLSHGSGS